MMEILSTINSPQDIKGLNSAQLRQLSEEIRRFLLSSLSIHGGHLAANLGVVELTLALHYVFSCPQDKLIWDVGHQSYVHKIITGRREHIASLRQFQGISGFPRREESEYDCFGTGHSSTSISAALGMVMARELNQESHSVISVIGDGALTGGMAFEALNHAGNSGQRLIVVLNDNAMSIAPNVGAVATHLNRLRSAPQYYRTKEKIEDSLNRIPNIGPNIARAVEKMKDTLRYLVVRGSLFEELGFTYIGPVDGHNLEELVAVFNNVREIDRPVLVHVVTQKGRGYQPAAQQPDVFHGIGPFDVQTGQTKQKSSVNYTDIFGDTLLELARQDTKIVAFTAAMASGTGLSAFASAFPQRFFDVGICEQHAVTMAAGMAVSGYRPFVCVYSTFLQRAYDQIVHDIALQKLPVVLAIDRAGLVGEDGPTHQGVFDLAFLSGIPNMTILSPGDGSELRAMMRHALTLEGPVAIRYPKAPADKGADAGFTEGRTRVSGAGIALLATGRMLRLAEDTAAVLQERYGLQPSVINIMQLKPLPEALLLQLAAHHDHIVTLEEGIAKGGMGSGILELFADRDLRVKVMRIGTPDAFVTHGSVSVLFESLGLTPQQTADRIAAHWPQLVQEKAGGF
jgi:1-deoxy-D-xylulose-5-phosphate synthase